MRAGENKNNKINNEMYRIIINNSRKHRRGPLLCKNTHWYVNSCTKDCGSSFYPVCIVKTQHARRNPLEVRPDQTHYKVLSSPNEIKIGFIETVLSNKARNSLRELPCITFSLYQSVRSVWSTEKVG